MKERVTAWLIVFATWAALFLLSGCVGLDEYVTRRQCEGVGSPSLRCAFYQRGGIEERREQERR